jgi:methylase of polypeptide subunit release factors
LHISRRVLLLSGCAVPRAAGFKGDRSETVVDLYCGTGTIALCLSVRSKEVYGVESDKEAVKDARFNAGHNDIGNARFLRADLSSYGGVSAVRQRVPRPDVVVAGMCPSFLLLLSCGCVLIAACFKRA